MKRSLGKLTYWTLNMNSAVERRSLTAWRTRKSRRARFSTVGLISGRRGYAFRSIISSGGVRKKSYRASLPAVDGGQEASVRSTVRTGADIVQSTSPSSALSFLRYSSWYAKFDAASPNRPFKSPFSAVAKSIACLSSVGNRCIVCALQNRSEQWIWRRHPPREALKPFLDGREKKVRRVKPS